MEMERRFWDCWTNAAYENNQAMSKTNSQQATATTARRREELNQFANEFPDEARLREVVAELLRKMGRTGVRIAHGANEKGKDILFHHEHGMGAPQLCACVVKNERITGSVSGI